jgi:Tol biopolymer transport system component
MESIMEQTAIKPFNLISEQDTELIRVPPTLSAEYIISSVKKHKFLSTVLAGVLLLIIGVGVASPWFASIQNRMGNVFTIGNDSVDSSKLEITRLTTTGRERWATISPDGKYIAHVTISPDEKRSLMVRQTSTSNSREIVPPANVQYRTPVFSPDGEYIYYVIYAGQKPALYRIPTLGGEPLLISENIRGRIGLSPDGEQVAHYSRNNPTRTPQLQVSSIKNLLDQKDEPQTIATLLPGNFSNPAWSPDGERIACIISDAETRIPKIVIYSVTGKEPQIIEVNFTQTGDSIVWLNNNELLITASNKDRYDPMQIWQVNLSGEVKRITNEWNNYYHLSITSDKATVIATQLQTNSNIFVASNENKNQLGFETQSFKQITNEVDVRFGHLGMAWTPDKRLIYHYVGIDKAQLRSVNSDGSNPRQLTPETVKMPEAPEVSSDGKSLIFSAPKDNSEIYLWRMNLSDGKISQLIFSSKNPWDTGFSLMPDGKTLIYSYISSDGKKGGLRRISVDGGEPTEILNPTDIFPVPEISPDSKHLAVMAQDFRLGLLTFPLADSNATPKFLNTNGIPPLGGEGRYFKWTPDSKSLIYIFKDKGVANLRVLPIDGSEAYNLTNFTDVQEIYSFALSTDGKRLAVARGMGNSDIVLVKNFN